MLKIIVFKVNRNQYLKNQKAISIVVKTGKVSHLSKVFWFDKFLYFCSQFLEKRSVIFFSLDYLIYQLNKIPNFPKLKNIPILGFLMKIIAHSSLILTNKFDFENMEEIEKDHENFTTSISKLKSVYTSSRKLGTQTDDDDVLIEQAIKSYGQLQESISEHFKNKNFIKFINKVAPQDSLFIIDSDDKELRKIFFHYLQFFQLTNKYKQCGIIYRINKDNRINFFKNYDTVFKKENVLHILIVFGKCKDSNGHELQVEKEKELWSNFQQSEYITVQCLEQPTYSQLKQAFLAKQVDIFYYKSHEAGETPLKLCINDSESITINEMCSLIHSAKNKLTLFMLMSCNSQEIAEEIIGKDNNCVDHIIASREILNDIVITDFLEKFLNTIRQKPRSTPIASIVREAKYLVRDVTSKDKLTTSAIAMFQSSNSRPLVWDTSFGRSFHDQPKLNLDKFFKNISFIIVSTVICFLVIINHIGIPEKQTVFSPDITNLAKQSTVSIALPRNSFYSGVIIGRDENYKDEQRGKNKYFILTSAKALDVLNSSEYKKTTKIPTFINKNSIMVFPKYPYQSKFDMIINQFIQKEIIDAGFLLIEFISDMDFYIPSIIDTSSSYTESASILITSFNKPREIKDDFPLDISTKISEKKTTLSSILNRDNNELAYNEELTEDSIGSPIFNKEGCLIGIHNQNDMIWNPQEGKYDKKKDFDQGISIIKFVNALKTNKTVNLQTKVCQSNS